MKKYLIIGSDCFMRGIMGLLRHYFKRIPGPIDNCKLLDPMGIDYILSGEYLEDIKDKNFQFQETKIESHLGNFIFKDKKGLEGVENESELATYIDNAGQINESVGDWTSDLR